MSLSLADVIADLDALGAEAPLLQLAPSSEPRDQEQGKGGAQADLALSREFIQQAKEAIRLNTQPVQQGKTRVDLLHSKAASLQTTADAWIAALDHHNL